MDVRFAMLACLVANCLSKKQDGSSFTLDDFLPWQMEKREQTVEDVVAIMERMGLEVKKEG